MKTTHSDKIRLSALKKTLQVSKFVGYMHVNKSVPSGTAMIFVQVDTHVYTSEARLNMFPWLWATACLHRVTFESHDFFCSQGNGEKYQNKNHMRLHF